MFSERFNSIFDKLNIKSRELGEFMECDNSYVNRVRSGNRFVSRSSRAANKMVSGLYVYIVKNGLYPKLCEITDCCTEDMSEAEGLKAFEAWLFEGREPDERQIKVRRRQIRMLKEAGVFAERFKEVIELIGQTNILLAKLVNVDAALMCRWRAGSAMPRKKEKQKKLAEVLLRRVYAEDKIDELSELMSVPPVIFEDIDEGLEYFMDWLYGLPAGSGTIVGNFLTDIDDISFGNMQMIPAKLNIEDAVLNDTKTEYTAKAGLREAVIRFLARASKLNYKELWLYSDQNMDWMTEDKDFLVKWFSLMLVCLKNGTQIKIIHNLERGLPELTAAIKSWLPLYMTGGIKAYYSRKPAGGRFSNTVFLAPEHEGIYNNHVKGKEDRAVYRYCTDKAAVAELEQMYTELSEDCRELIKIDIGGNGDYIEKAEQRGIHVLQNSLSLATMPEELLAKMSEGSSEDECLKLYAERERQKEYYMKNLDNAFVCEYVPLPTKEMLEGGLICAQTETADLIYDTDTFCEHIANIISICEKYENFRFIILPEPFVINSKVIIGQKNVTITNMAGQSTDLTTDHPVLVSAFLVYAEDLQQKYMPERLEEKRLNEYLVHNGKAALKHSVEETG